MSNEDNINNNLSNKKDIKIIEDKKYIEKISLNNSEKCYGNNEIKNSINSSKSNDSLTNLNERTKNKIPTVNDKKLKRNNLKLNILQNEINNANISLGTSNNNKKELPKELSPNNLNSNFNIINNEGKKFQYK